MPKITGIALPACYIHIPFCITKCRYCNFFSVEKNGCDTDRYMMALLEECEEQRDTLFDTVYVGGGTPTCLDTASLKELFEGLADTFDMQQVQEYTVEANPGTVQTEKLAVLQANGVNRLSIGCQSFDNAVLDFLGRIHSADDSRNTVEKARVQGFSNISIDIIYGVPGQTVQDVERDIKEACSLEPEHISCYQLSAEKGTLLAADIERGICELPDEPLICDMDRAVCAILDSRGYKRYEISNFAGKGFESLHNIHYWEGDEYAGFGAGAVSMRRGKRWKNAEDIGLYTKCSPASSAKLEYEECLTGVQREQELLMTGLRMVKGISDTDFRKKTGGSLLTYRSVFESLARDGFIEYSGFHVRMTSQGFPLLDEILLKIF